MKTIYLLRGLPGTGKTTFAKKNFKNALIVELDDVRQNLANRKIIGQEYSSGDNEIVFKHFYEEIFNAVLKNDVVVADFTSAYLSQREEIYKILSQFKPKFVVIDFIDNKTVACKNIIKRQTENANCVHVFKDPMQALKIYEERLQANPVTLNEPIAEIWKVKNLEVVEKQQKVLIASTNQGKIDIYKQIFNELNLPCTSLTEIAVNATVEETGSNELENATIKAVEYNKITGLPVVANDSGLIIDKFKPEDQPGVLVRRFHGKELADEQLLNVYIDLLTKVGGSSDGHYNVALAIINFNNLLHTKTFKPIRHFISTPSKVLLKGIPLSSLSYDYSTKKYMSEMTPAERNNFEAEAMLAQKEFIKECFCK